MKVSLVQSYVFHAAHTLHWHPGKCARPHGHSYTFEIRLTGELDKNGIIIDFDVLRPAVEALVLDHLDHSDLNDRFENPTAEIVCTWIFERLVGTLQTLEEVRLWETADSSVIVARS